MEYASGGELFNHIVENVKFELSFVIKYLRLNEVEACKYF